MKQKKLERIFFHYNWQWRTIGDAGRRFLCWRATAIADIAVTITNFINILIGILKCVYSECRSLVTTFVCGWDCVWTVCIRDCVLCTRRWPRWDCMRLICCRWCLRKFQARSFTQWNEFIKLLYEKREKEFFVVVLAWYKKLFYNINEI